MLQGDGSEQSPFVLTKAEEFEYIEENPNSYFELQDDIEFTDDTSVLSVEFGFNGCLDGNGYTVSGVRNPVFRSILGDSVVKNIRFSNCTVKEESLSSGVVARHNTGVIENCTVEDSRVVNETLFAGGIAGFNKGGTIRDSQVKNTVAIGHQGGSITGIVEEGCVENTTVESVKVSSKRCSGGLIGVVKSSSVRNCTCKNTTVVSEDYQLIGGGFSEVYSSELEAVSVSNCTVNGGSGFAGFVEGGRLTNITVDSKNSKYEFIQTVLNSQWNNILITEPDKPLFDAVDPISGLAQDIDVSGVQVESPDTLLAKFASDDGTVSLYSNDIVVQESETGEKTLFEVNDLKELLLSSELSTAEHVSESILQELTLQGL